eukprot:scaffold25193_cov29-Tisochrysis_lutea.AAC.2
MRLFQHEFEAASETTKKGGGVGLRVGGGLTTAARRLSECQQSARLRFTNSIDTVFCCHHSYHIRRPLRKFSKGRGYPKTLPKRPTFCRPGWY